MDHRCDCERGGNCTRTTMCHVQSVVDDLNGEHEIEIERLEADVRAMAEVVNAHGFKNAELKARVAELEGKINGAVNVGHNDDCMFCGFKDRALTSDVVLDQQKLRLAAQALGGNDE